MGKVTYQKVKGAFESYKKTKTQKLLKKNLDEGRVKISELVLKFQ